MRPKKVYSEAFKRAAVSRLNAGEPARKLCKELKIVGSMLYGWRKKFDKIEQTKNAFSKGRRPASPVHDAIIYLRHARTAMIEQVVSGQSKLEDPAYLFALLALKSLEGGR